MLLHGFDDDIRRHLVEELKAAGVVVRLSTRLAKVCPAFSCFFATRPN